MIIPVILAGGSGTRLWPESRSKMPKHLAPILGEQSLLQTTAKRVMGIEDADAGALVCVGAENQGAIIREQLDAIDPSWAAHLLLEPMGRNTAAAIDFAARYVASRFGPDAVIWVCPSDHIMADVPSLYQAVATGLIEANAQKIVTFGIKPSRPETGYGYIQADRTATSSDHGALAVARFVEKPQLDDAKAMVASGDYLWNSGMFLMRADKLSQSMAAFEPKIASAVTAAYQAFAANDAINPDLYQAIKSMPVDKAVMERSREMMVVPCDPDWSDVGGWEAIWEISSKDDQNNAVLGDVVIARSTNNLVRANSRLVALAGVDNLAVIEVGDAVLVSKRDAGDEIKEIVGALAEAGRSETDEHLRCRQDWGSTTTIGGSGHCTVHEHRFETNGQLGPFDKVMRLMVLDPGPLDWTAGSVITVAAGSTLAVSGRTDQPVVLLEVAIL